LTQATETKMTLKDDVHMKRAKGSNQHNTREDGVLFGSYRFSRRDWLLSSSSEMSMSISLRSLHPYRLRAGASLVHCVTKTETCGENLKLKKW